MILPLDHNCFGFTVIMYGMVLHTLQNYRSDDEPCFLHYYNILQLLRHQVLLYLRSISAAVVTVTRIILKLHQEYIIILLH